MLENVDQEQKKVLLVEDDEVTAKLLNSFLVKNGFETILATNGIDAHEKIAFEKPNIIICDIMMPDMDGYEFCRIVRSSPGLELIPFIFISALSDLDSKIKAFSLGADDFVTKTFDMKEVLTRIKRAIHRHEIFLRLSYVDSLTEIYNRRYFDEKIEDEMRRAKRYSLEVTLAVFDIDFFKKFNDSYGHKVGDFALNQLAGYVKEKLRQTDTICRYGGEEFSVVMPFTTRENGAMVMDRLRETLAKKVFHYESDDHDLTINISVGVACFPHDADNGEDLLKSADKALYRAKRSGRNRVCSYDAAKDENTELQ